MGNTAKKTTSAFILFLLFSILGCTGFEENTRLPIDLDLKNQGTVFAKTSDLYQTLQKTTSNETTSGQDSPCVEIVYPISLIKYDSELRPISSVNARSDAEFSQILGGLSQQESLSISFPITTVLADNTIYSVNNNTELNVALNNCTREDIVRYFCDVFVPPAEIKSIFWKVKYTENGDNSYYSGIFHISTGGYLNFYYNNKKYEGTWFLLIVDEKLHINIHLEDDSEVAAYWNVDRVMEVNGPEIIIKNTSKDIILEQIIESRTKYNVGDMGPSKGIVFYDKGEYTAGWRYMEVATEDLKSSEWGCSNTAITNARNTELGRGSFNTAQILKYHDGLDNYYQNPTICNSANNGSVLAKYAVRYIQQTNVDWFLPSANELELIYKNLYLNNLGDFTDSNYWTSTEIDESTVYTIDFKTGEKTSAPKIPAKNGVKARVIRYF